MDVASESEKWTHSRNSLNLDSFSWPAGGVSSWYKRVTLDSAQTWFSQQCAELKWKSTFEKTTHLLT